MKKNNLKFIFNMYTLYMNSKNNSKKNRNKKNITRKRGIGGATIRNNTNSPQSNRRLATIFKERNTDNMQQNDEIIELIRAGQYDVNYVYNIEDPENQGLGSEYNMNNLLEQAIMNKYFTAAAFLIRQNRNNEEFINHSNADGFTPLLLVMREYGIDLFYTLIQIPNIQVGSNKIIIIDRESGNDIIENFTTIMYAIYLFKSKAVNYGEMYEDMTVTAYQMLVRLIQLHSSRAINLSIEYANPQGLTALIYTLDIELEDISHDTNNINKWREIVNFILSTNNYNAASVFTGMNTYDERNTNALITACYTNNYNFLTHLVYNSNNNPDDNMLHFDLNHTTASNKNALFMCCSSFVGAQFRCINFLLDERLSTGNISINEQGQQLNSVLIIFLKEALYTILHELYHVNTQTEYDIYVKLFRIVERILRSPAKGNVGYIMRPSVTHTYTMTALFACMSIIDDIMSQIPEIERHNVDYNIIESLPLLFLREEETHNNEYLDVGDDRGTSLDIAMRLQLNQVVTEIQNIKRAIYESENVRQINLFSKGTTILGEERIVYNHISKSMNNFVFKMNDNIFLLNKNVIRPHVDDGNNIVYKCLERDVFNIQNVDRNVVYTLLNRYSSIPAIIKYEDIMNILNNKLVGQLFILEQDEILPSHINKLWFDYQIGANPDWSPTFNSQVFCRASPIALFNVFPAVPLIEMDNLAEGTRNELIQEQEQEREEQEQEQQGRNVRPRLEEGEVMEITEEPTPNEQAPTPIQVKARVTFRTSDNRLVEKGLKEFSLNGQTGTVGDLKNMIIEEISREEQGDLEVRRMIFSGRDYTNSNDTILSQIITNPDVNTFQPVIVGVRSQSGGKRKNINPKNILDTFQLERNKMMIGRRRNVTPKKK